MALTKRFRETVAERVRAEPEFGDALLVEGVQALLDGEVDVGKSLLRDYTNATTGFAAIAEDIGKSPKSVMRMFGAGGNPRTENLFAVLESLQRRTGRSITVTAVR